MEILDWIQDLLIQNENKGDAAQMKAYMKGQFEFLGIRAPLRKVLVKDIVALSKDVPLPELIELLDALWDLEHRDYQMVALDIMIRNKKRLGVAELANVHYWITTKSWWDTIDGIASHMVGNIAIRNKAGVAPFLEEWLLDDDIWLNRTCLIHQLKHHDQTDLALLFRYIDTVNHKKEFFIQKAIGWSLRQSSRYFPAEVLQYVDTHELSNLARREATKYL